jgi:hypothetical protein
MTWITASSSSMSKSVRSTPSLSNAGTFTLRILPGRASSIALATSPTSGSGDWNVRGVALDSSALGSPAVDVPAVQQPGAQHR